MEYRDHLPDECPPADAVEPDGIVYRLTRRNNPKPKDFRSQREIKPDKDFGNQDECIAGGLSVFKDISDAKRLRKRIPAKRKHKICSANLKPDHGKIKDTPSNHHKSHRSWWVPKHLEPWRLFSVVETSESD